MLIEVERSPYFAMHANYERACHWGTGKHRSIYFDSILCRVKHRAHVTLSELVCNITERSSSSMLLPLISA